MVEREWGMRKLGVLFCFPLVGLKKCLLIELMAVQWRCFKSVF